MKALQSLRFGTVFAALLLAVVAVVALAAVADYLHLERVERERITDLELGSLRQLDAHLSTVLGSLDQLGRQMWHDPQLAALLFYERLDPVQRARAVEQLWLYFTGNPHLDSIYIHNPLERRYYLVSSNPGQTVYDSQIDPGLESLLAAARVPADRAPAARILEYSHPSVPPAPVPVYTYVISEIAPSPDRPYLVVNASMERLFRGSGTDKGPEGSRTYIAARDHEVPLDEPSALSAAGRLPLPAAPGASGATRARVDGSVVYLYHVQSARLPWRLVRTVPGRWVAGYLQQALVRRALVILLILLAGVTATALASLRIYRPVRSVLGELDRLRARQANDALLLREVSLRNLLVQSAGVDASSLRDALEQYELRLEPGRPVRLVLLMVDGVSGEPVDRFLETVEAAAEQALDAWPRRERVRVGDDLVFLLQSGDGDLAEAPLVSALEELSRTLKQRGISVTAVVSESGGDLGEIGRLYAQVQETRPYRLVAGTGSVLPAALYQAAARPPRPYPADHEGRLAAALNAADAGEARAVVRGMLDGVRGSAFFSIETHVNRLCYALNQHITRVGAAGGPAPELDFGAFFARVKSRETLDEVLGDLEGVIESIVSADRQSRGSRKSALVSEVAESIRERHADPGLYSVTLAESFRMNAAYLARVFRSTMGVSIGEFTNRVRVEHARSLLRETDLPIAEIARSVGFQNEASFYRIFRKEVGMTPSVYRRRGL